MTFNGTGDPGPTGDTSPTRLEFSAAEVIFLDDTAEGKRYAQHWMRVQHARDPDPVHRRITFMCRLKRPDGHGDPKWVSHLLQRMQPALVGMPDTLQVAVSAQPPADLPCLHSQQQLREFQEQWRLLREQQQRVSSQLQQCLAEQRHHDYLGVQQRLARLQQQEESLTQTAGTAEAVAAAAQQLPISSAWSWAVRMQTGQGGKARMHACFRRHLKPTAAGQQRDVFAASIDTWEAIYHCFLLREQAEAQLLAAKQQLQQAGLSMPPVGQPCQQYWLDQLQAHAAWLREQHASAELHTATQAFGATVDALGPAAAQLERCVQLDQLSFSQAGAATRRVRGAMPLSSAMQDLVARGDIFGARNALKLLQEPGAAEVGQWGARGVCGVGDECSLSAVDMARVGPGKG
jgi:hypothetical protein